MGCLQTKTKEKPKKFVKVKYGQFNKKWKNCLIKDKLNINPVENSNQGL